MKRKQKALKGILNNYADYALILKFSLNITLDICFSFT